ncbi:MAG: ABC transporter substrate-binding protein [Candidatus Aminicenantia bacterium]
MRFFKYSFSFFIILFSLTKISTSIEVKDELGRKVKVPDRVERLVSLQPEITRIILSLGGREKLSGIDYFMKYHDHIFTEIFPDTEKLPLLSHTSSDLNLELIAKLKPDLLIISPTESQMIEKIEKSLKIPLLALSSMGNFKNLEEEIELLSILTGEEKRGNELIRYLRSKISLVKERLKSINSKPTVYLSFWSSITRTPVKYEPVSLAGGINVAEGLPPAYKGTLGTVVSLEKIIEWDPEVILIHGNYPPEERGVTVEGILSDGRLSSLSAVKTKRVYYTFGFWYWWDPALALFETIYLSKLFHPSSFEDLELLKEGREIFKKFYGSDKAFDILIRKLKFNEWKIE